ncbi:MAG: SDR family oxidoreductase [Verrucomicrobiota bacterium]
MPSAFDGVVKMTVPARRALVTGGSRGLGLAICRRLLSDGFFVMTASRTVSVELKELLRSHRGKIEHHPVDFAQADGALALAKAARLLDGVYAYVANAAIGTEGLLSLSSEAELRECIQVNLTAPMVLAREAIKGMVTQGEGNLIFVASVAARTGFPGLAAYSATKGGLVSFSRALAREYGAKGIRSNAVLPGFLETEMSARLSPEVQKVSPVERL